MVMGKKYPPQAFVGIPAGDFFLRGDGELFPDGEFSIAISNLEELFAKIVLQTFGFADLPSQTTDSQIYHSNRGYLDNSTT